MYKKFGDKVHLCAEVGSTHMGRKEYIEEIIDKCIKVGVDSVKFQLFPNQTKYTMTGNVHLSKELFQHAFEYGHLHGMSVTASVFGENEALFLQRFPVQYVKLAYSMKDNLAIVDYWRKKKIPVVITSDHMTRANLPDDDGIIHLWTATMNGETLYPCPFLIDFEGMFKPKGKFDGFSDHTIGMEQARLAITHGAKFIEKHVSLPYADITCPDARFALKDLYDFRGNI